MSVIVQSQKHHNKFHHRFNNILTVLVVSLGMYILIMPFWPQISYFFRNKLHHNQEISYTSVLRKDASSGKPIPKDNRLVIPQMELDGEIHEGKYASTLQKGIWHRPQTSTPDKGGNTVFVAHRFTYKTKAYFYHLDKLGQGDKFVVFWNDKEYDYKVREVKVVNPDDIQIEDNTTEPILTLYTCTPLWTAKQRLVVISDLIQGDPSS